MRVCTSLRISREVPMPFDRLTVFWIAMAISLILFILGLSVKVSFWSQGQVRDAHGRRVLHRKAWVVFKNAIGVVFSRRFFRALKAFITDGMLHRTLLWEDRYRWGSHLLMFGGFLIMFALSIITGFFEEILHHMLGVDTALVRFFTNKDTPFIALANEILGPVILAGLILAAVRRFILRPEQLRTTMFDTNTMILLAFILLTGYPIEAFRLLMENTPPEVAWNSFIGYPLALLLRPLAWHWEMWHYWTFMAHIAACFALLIMMPFSKFFHVLISPIIATVNRLDDLEAEVNS